jgi:hypothetical protein
LKRISRCQVAGILPTFYERVTLESHEQLIHLAQTFGKLGAAAYPTGYPMPCGNSLREDAVGLRPECQSLNGYEQGNRRVGGYLQVLERVKEWL